MALGQDGAAHARRLEARVLGDSGEGTCHGGCPSEVGGVYKAMAAAAVVLWSPVAGSCSLDGEARSRRRLGRGGRWRGRAQELGRLEIEGIKRPGSWLLGYVTDDDGLI